MCQVCRAELPTVGWNQEPLHCLSLGQSSWHQDRLVPTPPVVCGLGVEWT